TLEDLRRVVPQVVAGARRAPRGAASSPGTKHRHYQPSCRVEIVRPGQWAAALKRVRGGRVGVLSFRRLRRRTASVIFSRAFGGDSSRFARELYAAFFAAEKAGVKTLLVESI